MVDDYGLIVSSFQSQYGIRLTKELKHMKWAEFSALLSGIDPDTALGRIVSIRSETDEKILKHFTADQNRIRSEWMNKTAKERRPEDTERFLEQIKNGFIRIAGGKRD